MKVDPAKEKFLTTTIRDAVAVNPLISIRGMQEIVERNTGRSISDKYVAKLMLKIRQRVVVESDRKMINERLSEVRERYRVLMEYLTRVIYWRQEFLVDYGIQCPSFKERLMAIKLLSQMETALFRTELYAGMFENKQIAINEVLRQGVLPTELHEQIIGVFRTWKLKSPEKENKDASLRTLEPCDNFTNYQK